MTTTAISTKVKLSPIQIMWSKISESKKSIAIEYLDELDNFKGLSIPTQKLSDFADSKGYLEWNEDSIFNGVEKQTQLNISLLSILENDQDLSDNILIHYIKYNK